MMGSMTVPRPVGGAVPWFDAAQVAELLPMSAAIDAIEAALVAGLDTAAGPPRSTVETAHGQVLMMPAESLDRVGVKIVSVAPGNTDRGLPRIQGVYLLLDAQTLTPVALLDGIALTSLRTPAMSAVAVRHLATAGASSLVVFGTGPQARGHVEAMRAVRPVNDVVVVGRDPGRTDAFVDNLAATGVRTSSGPPEAVADADLVVCATTSGEPLFDGQLVPDSACVVAVGSHEPFRRELDAVLMSRARVVVEDVATALREAGDVAMAVSEGVLAVSSLLSVADVVTGRVRFDGNRPRVFKSVGMAWQDLVAAAQIHRGLR
jgi:ornithine cyclodeaminase